MKNIVEKFKSLGIDESKLQQIEEAFNERVEDVVKERMELETAGVLKEQAEEHTEILNTIFAKSEEVKTTELEEQNTKHIGALKSLLEKHEQIIKVRATEHRDDLVEDISEFLDEQLIKLVPNESIVEAAQNNIARKLMSKVKDLVGLDEEYVSENVRKALGEGKQLVEEQAEEIKKWKIRSLKSESVALIAEQTKDLPEAKAQHITEHFEGKSPQFIKRNFDYVSEMFERSSKKERRVATRRTRSNVESRNVDRPLLNEKKDDELQKIKTEADDQNLQLEAAEDPHGYLAHLKYLDN